MSRTRISLWPRLAAGILLLLAVGAGSAVAQTASVRGFAINTQTGQPLPTANVALLQNEEVVRGVAASRDGSFLIGGLEPGRYVIRATFVGFQAFRDTIQLESGDRRELRLRLAPITEEMEEVRVEAEDEMGAASAQAGFQRLEPEDLRRTPTPGLSADLASYMSIQPGVVALGNRGGGLYIRGGEPSQNRLYVDRIPVYQPFHMIGFYSAVPSSIVQRTDLYAGGYPPSYTGGLSSVIDVGSRTGNMRRFEGSATLSPFISSAAVSGPVVPGELSVLGSYRHSMLEHGAARYVDEPLPFTFSDGFGKLYWQVSPTERVIASGLFSGDTGTLGSAPVDSAAQEVRWSNRGGSLRYLFLPSTLTMRAEAFVAYSKLTSELGPARDPIRSSNLSNLRIGGEGTFPGETISVRTGFRSEFIGIDTRLGGLFQNVETGSSPTLVQLGLFATPEIRLLPGNQLQIEPGLRIQYYDSGIHPYLEPRLRIRYERTNQVLTLAGGRFHQELLGLNDRRDVASIFTGWKSIGSAPRQLGDVLVGRAYHGASSYRIGVAPGLELATGGFYRTYTNLFVQEWSSVPRFATNLQAANGRSYGGSVRLEFDREPFYGFLNYGYSNTRYTAATEQFELWYGEEKLSFRPPHDQRHQVNAVFGFARWGYELRVRWSGATGRPYSRPLGFDGFVYMNDLENQFRTESERRVIYEEPFNATLPPYHRLDVSLQKTLSLSEQVDLTVQGSLINAYDRPNIFYLDVFTAQREDQLPLVPSFGLKLEVGR